MGEKNNVLNVYMSKPRRIQSILEFCIKKKLPEDWYLSCTEAEGFYSVENGEGKKSFRQRDIFKKIITEEGFFYLGIENQENINLTFPWRLMQMDCLEYERQIEELQQANKEKKVNYKKEDDFLYSFREQDRLIPIVNIVLYWGKRRWKKPLSIKEMMNEDFLPQEMRKLFRDYKVYLIHMRSIPEEALNQMDSDLKYVLGLLKRAGNKKRYEKYIIENEEFFSRVTKSAMDVLKIYMNIPDIMQRVTYIKNTEGEECADMCKALEGIKEDAEKKGRREGKREGRREGRKEIRFDATQKLMKNLKVSAQQAMELLEIPKKEQKEYLQMLSQ